MQEVINYKVSFYENGKSYSFDFSDQREALEFFNFSRQQKTRSEVKVSIERYEA